jgi:hypothetical protein
MCVGLGDTAPHRMRRPLALSQELQTPVRGDRAQHRQAVGRRALALRGLFGLRGGGRGRPGHRGTVAWSAPRIGDATCSDDASVDASAAPARSQQTLPARRDCGRPNRWSTAAGAARTFYGLDALRLLSGAPLPALHTDCRRRSAQKATLRCERRSPWPSFASRPWETFSLNVASGSRQLIAAIQPIAKGWVVKACRWVAASQMCSGTNAPTNLRASGPLSLFGTSLQTEDAVLKLRHLWRFPIIHLPSDPDRLHSRPNQDEKPAPQ